MVHYDIFTYNYTRAFFCRSKLDISMRILLTGNVTKKLPLKKLRVRRTSNFFWQFFESNYKCQVYFDTQKKLECSMRLATSSIPHLAKMLLLLRLLWIDFLGDSFYKFRRYV
jgi:hypothetical protein